jgi:hypothetical protein
MRRFLLTSEYEDDKKTIETLLKKGQLNGIKK